MYALLSELLTPQTSCKEFVGTFILLCPNVLIVEVGLSNTYKQPSQKWLPYTKQFVVIRGYQ